MAAEGINQVQQRPSVGAVVLFGVAGLAARKKESRSYLTVATQTGDYAFQVEGLLPAALAALVSPVARHFQAKGDAPKTDPIETIRRLGELRDEGLLTSEEFEAKKQELLKQL
jgi:hypothetical protein